MDRPNLTGDLSWAQVDWERSSSFLVLFISRLFRITFFVVISHRLLSFFCSSVLTASVVIHWTVPEEWQLSFLQPVSWRLMQLFCSTSEANTILICSCHSISGRFNHGCPVSYPILLSYSLMIPLVPFSARMLIPLKSFHRETSVVSNIYWLSDWSKKLVYTIGDVYPLQYASWFRPQNCKFVSVYSVAWSSVLSASVPRLALSIPVVVMKDPSFVPFSIFQIYMPSLASNFLFATVDKPMHTYLIVDSIRFAIASFLRQ